MEDQSLQCLAKWEDLEIKNPAVNRPQCEKDPSQAPGCFVEAKSLALLSHTGIRLLCSDPAIFVAHCQMLWGDASARGEGSLWQTHFPFFSVCIWHQTE